ncbi:uncharacterized protein BDV14DRAFT_178414 [Aspergillus stella-maris]|uniref:uncharacterized protein n=1 Tax=Aspergillus stella-maris TaxID=1810926 RepID=UPI003CCE1079
MQRKVSVAFAKLLCCLGLQQSPSGWSRPRCSVSWTALRWAGQLAVAVRPACA